MIEVPFLAEFVHTLKKSSIDDFVDRLLYYTTLLLIFFALLISARHFVSPIECMMPAEYPPTWMAYVKSFCYINSTYIVSAGTPLVVNSTTKVPLTEENSTVKVHVTQGYYQWVAFILVIQALLLYFPYVAWKVYLHTQNIDYQHVVERAKALRFVMGDEQQQGLKDITGYLRERMQHQKTKDRVSFAGFGMKSSLSHVFAKILAIVVIILEISFINANFGPAPDPFWGITMIQQGMTASKWQYSGIFPRLTFCDFDQPILGGIYPRRTVQCVLPQNMINEKIFIFVWIWLALLLIYASFDFFYSVFTLFTSSQRRKSVKYFVQPGMKDNKDAFEMDATEKQKMIDFAFEMFGPDGIYLLDCIKLNGGSLIATDIATHLVENLYEQETSKKKDDDDGKLKPTAPPTKKDPLGFENFDNEYSLTPEKKADEIQQPPLSPPH